MIPDRYAMLFVLCCCFQLAENETQLNRVLNDIRQEVASLEAQGVTAIPEYVTEILATWGDCFTPDF